MGMDFKKQWGVLLILAEWACLGVGAGTGDPITKLVGSGINRFEQYGEAICADGQRPDLSGFVQYRSENSTPTPSWDIGRAVNYAPFIWLSKEGDKPKVWFSSLVIGEWIYCDDDGDEFIRRKYYMFKSRYNLEKKGESFELSENGFLKTPYQAVGVVETSSQFLSRSDLRDASFFYNDPVVDGPSEHWSFITPKTVMMGADVVDDDTLKLTFEKLCPGDKPFVAMYKRSQCPSAYECNETPTEKPGQVPSELQR
jgi:hypothetical protein